MNLKAILQPHLASLGNGFERLGRASGRYLCYQGGRFTLVRRSWITRIFERILLYLGCSLGTDLKTIAHQIGKEAGVPEPLLKKIHGSWSRTFPRIPCPFDVLVVARGIAIENPPFFQPAIQAPVNEVPGEPVLPIEIQIPPAAPVQAKPYRLRIGGTLLSLENKQLTKMQVQAIANPTILPREVRNGSLNGPENTISHEIFQAAGVARLTGECRQVLLAREEKRKQDVRIVGRALPEIVTIVKTSAGELPPPIFHIFHIIAPPYNPENDFMNRANLKLAVRDLLDFARIHQIKSLAIPLMDRWGYPPLLVVETYWVAIQGWLQEHKGVFKEIKFSVQGTETFFRDAREKAEARLQNFAEKL